MKKARQGEGFGREFVPSLLAHLSTCPPLTAIRIEVYLKNWPALRFWLNHGFATIQDMRGAKTASPAHHASLILERAL